METEKIFLTGWRGACIYLGVVSRVHTPPARRKHAGVTTPAIIINPFSAIPPGYAYPLLLNRTAVARHAACSSRKNRASRGGTKGQSPHLQSEWKIWRNAIWRDCFPFAGGRGRNAVVPTALIDSVPLSLSRFRSTMMAEARPCRSDMTEIRREEQDRIRERIQGSEMEVKCACDETGKECGAFTGRRLGRKRKKEKEKKASIFIGNRACEYALRVCARF